MSSCCEAVSNHSPLTWRRSVREILAWVLPSAGMLLMPKCPACLAAYVTLWTGVGLSLATAIYLRWALLLLCLAALLLLILERLNPIAVISRYSNTKSKP